MYTYAITQLLKTTLVNAHCLTTLANAHCLTTLANAHCLTTLANAHCLTTLVRLQKDNDRFQAGVAKRMHKRKEWC